MNTDNVMNAIAALDLEPVKSKLMHVASGEGWSRSKADALDVEYRRFLYLMYAFPDDATAPTVDVDTFWHYHILDTVKYAADCGKTFGFFLHHYPYLGMEGEHDIGAQERGGERMRELYEQTFGQDYIRAEAYGTAHAQAAYCGIRPPGDKNAQAAYCGIRPPGDKNVQAAYCGMPPGDKKAQAAYCGIRPPGDKKAQGAQASEYTYAVNQAAKHAGAYEVFSSGDQRAPMRPAAPVSPAVSKAVMA